MATRARATKPGAGKPTNANVSKLTALCDHHMISRPLARNVIQSVMDDRRTPDEAVSYLSRICTCGNFDATRAKRVLEEACGGAT